MTGMTISSRSPVGPGASAIKYDILTALLSAAACGEPMLARLSLRLSLLITARYNWRHGTLGVGRTEMARMWGVTERTAKRDLARMKSLGWLKLHVPAARGRVAIYKIDLDCMMAATRPFWDNVGPDFTARMTQTPVPEPSNVVPLRPGPPVADDGSAWSRVAMRLQAADPAMFQAWFVGLHALDIEGERLVLSAPTRFIASYVTTKFMDRIFAAAAAEFPGLKDIQVTFPD